ILFHLLGLGSAPERLRLADVVRRCDANGVLCAAVSRCPQGQIALDVFESTADLALGPLIALGNMTPDAALTKPAWCGGLDADRTAIRILLAANLCGERDQRGNLPAPRER